MRLLLDTDACLWFTGGSERMSRNAREAIEDERNDRFVGIGSLWEITIKTSIGKLTPHVPLTDLLSTQLQVVQADVLAIDVAHLTRLATLPFHHRDPFDRLLIAQALTEQMLIVSSDPALDAYGVQRLW
jgi:PIN domain nuclease of toxin-antitoxin system